MTSHLNGDEIKRIRIELRQRYGEVCTRCGKTPMDLNVPNLECHEIKYERPLKIENFAFLCHGCNRLKDLRKNEIMDKELSASHRKNIESKPLFERWLRTTLQENNHHYPLNEVIASGAYICDCNVMTVKRWLEALCSKAGLYVIAPSEYGRMHVYEKEFVPAKEDLI